MPAPQNNVNAVKHGGRSVRSFAIGEWGKRHRTAYAYAKRLRRRLESQTLAAHGDVSLDAAAEIDAASRWEMVAKVTQKIIATNADLEPDQLVSYLKTIMWAVQHRNVSIGRLGLNGSTDQGDPWALLDAQRAMEGQPGEPPADTAGEPSDAPAANVGDVEAIE